MPPFATTTRKPSSAIARARVRARFRWPLPSRCWTQNSTRMVMPESSTGGPASSSRPSGGNAGRARERAASLTGGLLEHGPAGRERKGGAHDPFVGDRDHRPGLARQRRREAAHALGNLARALAAGRPEVEPARLVGRHPGGVLGAQVGEPAAFDRAPVHLDQALIDADRRRGQQSGRLARPPQRARQPARAVPGVRQAPGQHLGPAARRQSGIGPALEAPRLVPFGRAVADQQEPAHALASRMPRAASIADARVAAALREAALGRDEPGGRDRPWRGVVPGRRAGGQPPPRMPPDPAPASGRRSRRPAPPPPRRRRGPATTGRPPASASSMARPYASRMAGQTNRSAAA